ncbi:hypothetical protein K2Z84_04990 [Candidatus Binatia bacterium]|jgi:hypothetical protein|nr:hypothetical protein [Candidatus Binatia bacterium]
MTLVILGACGILFSASTARALQIGQVVQKSWWNINGAGCGGTALDPDNGGDRAVKSISKLEVLSQIGQHKAKLHLNTNTFYDPGAAQAAYLYPILFGRPAACWEVAAYVGQNKWHVFRDLACSGGVTSAWRERLGPFCALPDGVLWGAGNQPSRVYAAMLGSGCSVPPGERSRERLTWNALKAKYGKRGSLIGQFTVFFDAITIDVGVDQQTVLDPGIVQSNVTFWNAVAWYAISRGWPAIFVTGTTGQQIFDISWYEAFFQTYDVFSLLGSPPKAYRDHVGGLRIWNCAGNPDAKTALDPFDLSANESSDGALRNLFDELADVPQGTDVICSAKGICDNLLDFAKAIYAQPGNGKSVIKSWIVKLIRG